MGFRAVIRHTSAGRTNATPNYPLNQESPNRFKTVSMRRHQLLPDPISSLGGGAFFQMTSPSDKATAVSLLSVIRAEDQIAGFCPSCHGLVRLSEVELFYIPDRENDFLTELRRKETELTDRIHSERQDAIKRSRASLMGNLFES